MPQESESALYRFCPRCSSQLEEYQDGAVVRRRCHACGFVHYHNPVPAAGGVICRRGRVLLVRRAVEPRKGYWSLPAGFMEYDETARECAERELFEETGLEVLTGEVLGVYSGFDDPRQHAVLIVFWMTEKVKSDPVAGDDADEVAFFSESDLPVNIAFRAHREALRDLFSHPEFPRRGF